MIIKRKKINYFFLVFALNFFIPIFAMEEEQKRKRNSELALQEEIEKIKRDTKGGHIAKTLRLVKSGACKHLDNRQVYALQNKLELPFLAFTLDALKYGNLCRKKHDLLFEATKERDIEAAKILLADGVKPDYVFTDYEKEDSTSMGVWDGFGFVYDTREVKHKKILQNANPKFFNLFLQNGLSPDTRWKGGNCEQKSLLDSALRDEEYWTHNPNYLPACRRPVFFPFANILLYHGATIEKKSGGYESTMGQDSFMNHAHARRVYRLAKYLQRCFGTVKHPKAEHALFLPNEIALMIAERRYGPLSEEDKKLIEGYHEDDYKKLRK